MSREQLNPTADAQIIIPSDVARQLTTREELDVFIKAESDRRGLAKFWYILPKHLLSMQMTQAGASADTGSPGAGSLALGGLAMSPGATSDVCHDADAQCGEVQPVTRRSVVARAMGVLGAIAAFALVGRKPAAAQSCCYYCGSSCVFSELYGTYQLQCNWKYTGSTICKSCCILVYYGYGCACPDTHARRSTACNSYC